MLTKEMLVILAFLLLSSGAAFGADEYDPTYERRAQEIIKTLQLKHGLAGAAYNKPADWLLSPPEESKYHLLVVDDPRDICSSWCVSWDDSSPKKLTGLYLTRLGLHGTLDLSGLTSLQGLSVAENHLAGPFDPSVMPALTMLNVAATELREINLSANPNLTSLNVSYNRLDELDLRANPALNTLIFMSNERHDNKPFQINLKNNQALTNLTLYSLDLDSLDLGGNPRLISLDVSDNPLGQLDLRDQQQLERLSASHVSLASLDLGDNSNLEYLDVAYNNLSRLDISRNTNLKRLLAYNNRLTELDLSNNPKLVELGVQRTKLSRLDLSHNPALIFLNIGGTAISELNLNCNEALEHFDAFGSHLNDLTLPAQGLRHLKTFYAGGCRLPLSRLAALGDIAGRYSELSPQRNVFFETKNLGKAGKAVFDFSSEAVLKGQATDFTVLTESGEKAPPESFRLESGRVTFTRAGRYKVLMSNPAIKSKSQFRGKSVPVEAFSGEIVVESENDRPGP